MEPLKQWVCDVCGKIIESPKKAYVVWKCVGDDKNHFEYRIIHQGRRDGCDIDSSYKLSLSIVDFLGDKGVVNLLSLIDVGPFHREEYKLQIKNIRDFLEFFRRVQLPYYEEARLYWDNAYNDGFFNGANELWIYLPSTLEELIKKYKNN